MDLAQVRSLGRQGHLLQALREIDAIADDQTRPVEERVEALLLASRFAGQRELFIQSVSYANRSIQLAAEYNLTELQVLGSLYLGCAECQAGSYHDAETTLLGFLEALSGYPTLEPHRAVALYRLGTAYERQRRPDPAVQLYTDAAILFEAVHNSRWAIDARHNAAWLLLRLGCADEAAEHLDHAAALLEAGLAHQQADHLALQAVYRLKIGCLTEAANLAEEVLSPPGAPGASDWTRTCAAWVTAQVASDEGQAHLARHFSLMAARYAPECKDAALMNLVTALRAQLGPEA